MSENAEIEEIRNRPSKTLASALEHRHRRQALWCLAKSNAALHLADLARYIAKLEAGTEQKILDNDKVRTLYIELYHIHLPKLAETGAVSFNPETTITSFEGDRDWIEPYIENHSSLDDQFSSVIQ